MLKFLISFALALFTLTAQADPTDFNPNDCSGAVNGRVSPWDYSLSPKNPQAAFLIYHMPFIPEIYDFKCIKTASDIIPKEGKNENQLNFIKDIINETGVEVVNVILNSANFASWLIVLFVIGVIFTEFSKYLDKAGNEDLLADTLERAISHAVLLAINIPMLGGILSIIQYIALYGVFIGISISGMEVRAILNAYQMSDITTSNVDIEQRVKNNSEKNKGAIYSQAYEYENQMIMTALCSVRSENLVYENYKVVPKSEARNTTTSINGTTITVANTFYASGPTDIDVYYKCGNITPKLPTLSGELKAIAEKIELDKALNSIAGTVNLDRTDGLKRVWDETKEKIMEQLNIKDISKITNEERNKLYFFLEYISKYASTVSLFDNSVNNSSFKKLENNNREIGILLNSAICLAGNTAAMENKKNVITKKSVMCGYFKDGEFGELISKGTNTQSVLINKAKSLLKTNLDMIQKANMEIEAIYEEARLELSNSQDFVSYSECGSACMTNAFKFAERNSIDSNLNSYRKSIDALATANINFFGTGSAEFLRIQKNYDYKIGDTEQVFTELFKDFVPAQSMNISGDTLITNTVNSRVNSQESKINSGSWTPLSLYMESALIPETADFSASGYSTCFTEGKDAPTCPAPRVGFYEANNNMLSSLRNTGENVMLTGMFFKFAISAVKTGAGAIDSFNSKKNKDNASKGVGSISNKDVGKDSSKANSGNLFSKLSNVSDQAINGLSDAIISIGGYILMITVALNYVIQLNVYLTFVNAEILFFISVIVILITMPVWTLALLMSSGINSVYKAYVRVISGFIIYQVLLVLFVFLIHIFTNVYYVGLFILINASESIMTLLKFSAFSKGAASWILLAAYFLFGSWFFIKEINKFMFQKLKVIMEVIDGKSQAIADNTADIIYAGVLFGIQRGVRIAKNKDTATTGVTFKETKDKLTKRRENRNK